MKKVLLSLSMLAAIMTANAQSVFVGVGAYDDFTTQTGDGNTTGEYSKQFTSNGKTQTSGIFWYKDGEYPATYTITRANGVMTVAVDKAAEYSVVGAGFGDDNGEVKDGEPFFINATAAKKFSVKIKATADVTVKVQFEDADGNKAEADASLKEYAKSLTGNAAFVTWDVDLTGGQGLAWPGPTAVPGFDPARIAKLNFLISGGAAYKGTVTFDDLKLGNVSYVGLGTASAAAKVASTKVFPNPSTSAFTAEVSLNNAASTTVILSDMMGKQISSQSVNAEGQATFQTSGLANGIYTVTYVVDGTPAKSELVVVK